MKKIISFTILIMAVLTHGHALADPGHQAPINYHHELVHFLTSPKHLISLGFLMVALGLIGIYKRMRNVRIRLRIR